MDTSDPIRPASPPYRGIARRLALGCAIVLLASAAASATAVLGEVHRLRDALSSNPVLNLGPAVLAPTGWGSPETLLLVGNDQRNHTTTTPVLPHSNEMLLVRFDPSKPYISMMSIPRELEVTIQCPNGLITTRLNYALTCGGFATLVSTIHQVTGLSINHVVMIDFNHFETAVNEMGCVYSTVDRRYFHVNVPGGPQYQEINLQPGYQQLCGPQALQFVSYRHGDTSVVRDARDQDFLLDVKKEYGPTLADNVHKFEQIFGQSVQTDAGLRSTTGILNFLGTLISSASLRVRQVNFSVDLSPPGPNPCACVTASPQQIAADADSFLNGGSASLPKQITAADARALPLQAAGDQLPLVATSPAEVAQGEALAGRGLPVEFPRVEDRGGSGVPVSMRAYLIHDQHGAAYPAYVAVFSAGQLGQYYDLQGMTWTSAPLLNSPDQTVAAGGRTYYLYYDGQHLQVIAWHEHEHHAVYWIHNSLTDALGNGELLAIAEQTVTVGSGAASGSPAPVRLRAATVPARSTSGAASGANEFLGWVAALLTIIVLPVLAAALLIRRRELRGLHAIVETNRQLESRLLARLAAAGLGTGVASVTGSRGHAPPAATTYATYRASPSPGTTMLRAVVVAAMVAGAVAAAVLAFDASGDPVRGGQTSSDHARLAARPHSPRQAERR